MRRLWLLMAVWMLPVAASDFGTRYPAGSIRDAEQAQAVLKEADAEMTRIGQSARERDAECLRKFLVNSCRDDVRREKELAEREVRRVRVEARDLQRRIDAEKVAKRRADKAAALAAEEAKRAQNAEKARATSKAREPQVKRPDPVATKEGSPASASRAQNAEPHARQPGQEKLTAAERAENARKFQQKQEQAQKRAQEMEVERKENEQRRIEKRKQIEQREAEREAIRKKAAESIK
jgi:colicin import membrane protein